MFSKLNRNQLSELVKMSGVYIGAGVEAQGEITTEDDIFIDSKFKGQISSEGAVDIGKNCRFSGNISARTIIIEGIVQSNAVANDTLLILNSAEFTGTAEARSLTVEKGAAINAKLKSTHK